VISTGECNRLTHSLEVLWGDVEKECLLLRQSAR
jgi:hypothetical protein